MMRPEIGDSVTMNYIGGEDAEIVVEEVPSYQPYEADGIFIIRDQYNEVHYVEDDAGVWVATDEP